MISNNIDIIKETLRSTDLAFSEESQEKGLAIAFGTYASNDAIHVSGNGTLTIGREAIIKLMSKFERSFSMKWEPEIIEIDSKQQIGITKGNYQVFSIEENNPLEIVGKGEYLTIWKRSMQNTWKFIYDMDGGIFLDK